MSQESRNNRRQFISGAVIGGSTLAVAGLPGIALAQARGAKQKGGPEEDVSPAEDLMREHGVLKRVLLIYREPHEAREDTVLFPAFRQIVSPHEYDALGEQFEKKEHQLFGEEGFEKNVEEVAALETMLGIHDLAQFTPAG